MKQEPRRIFLVVRKTQNARENQLNSDERVPVRAFATKAKAENHCNKLEKEAKEQFDYLTLFSEHISDNLETLPTTISQLGLPAFAQGDYFTTWWGKHGSNVTAEQRCALCDALPRCRIYEVIESKLVD